MVDWFGSHGRSSRIGGGRPPSYGDGFVGPQPIVPDFPGSRGGRRVRAAQVHVVPPFMAVLSGCSGLAGVDAVTGEHVFAVTDEFLQNVTREVVAVLEVEVGRDVRQALGDATSSASAQLGHWHVERCGKWSEQIGGLGALFASFPAGEPGIADAGASFDVSEAEPEVGAAPTDEVTEQISAVVHGSFLGQVFLARLDVVFVRHRHFTSIVSNRREIAKQIVNSTTVGVVSLEAAEDMDTSFARCGAEFSAVLHVADPGLDIERDVRLEALGNTR